MDRKKQKSGACYLVQW